MYNITALPTRMDTAHNALGYFVDSTDEVTQETQQTQRKQLTQAT